MTLRIIWLAATSFVPHPTYFKNFIIYKRCFHTLEVKELIFILLFERWNGVVYAKSLPHAGRSGEHAHGRSFRD